MESFKLMMEASGDGSEAVLEGHGIAMIWLGSDDRMDRKSLPVLSWCAAHCVGGECVNSRLEELLKGTKMRSIAGFRRSLKLKVGEGVGVAYRLLMQRFHGSDRRTKH
jgi:hypothetical protein